MSIYVNNGPIVFDAQGGDKYITIEIDGNSKVDGKKVVEWTNIYSNESWVHIVFDEEQYEDGYYYGFDLNVDATNKTSQRFAICYLGYILEDGTNKTESFYVYQEGNSSIIVDCENPLRKGADDMIPQTVQVRYNSTAIRGLSNNSNYFNITQISDTLRDNYYYVDYEITPRYYNVNSDSNVDTQLFSYSNSTSDSVTLHLVQESCPYPFGLTKGDGSAVPEEKYMANPAYKRWRDISSKANSVKLRCNFPFGNVSNIEVSLDTFYENSATLSISNEILGGNYEGLCQVYTVNFTNNTLIYTRRVDINVTYTTSDGLAHSDSVQLYQNASDGSNIDPEIFCGIEEIHYKYDGTPSMASNTAVTITWIGNFDSKNFYTNSNWVMLGNPELVSDNGEYNKAYRYPITVEENSTNSPRISYLYFEGKIGSRRYTKSIKLVQGVEIGDACSPIWRDIVYDFGDVDSVTYSIFLTDGEEDMTEGDVIIKSTDKLIFNGRTNKRPNSEHNTILVNKICQNFLETAMLNNDKSSNFNGYNIFKLTNEGGNELYNTYRFVNDWSYSDEFKSGLLSHPILNDRTVVRGQMLPFTVFGAINEVEVFYGINYEGLPSYSNSVIVKNRLQTECFPYSLNLNNATKFFIGDMEWDIVDDCKVEYVLYYVNPWGGFDWFPIKGKVTEIDDITQYVYTQNYNNTTWEFGKKRYLSEINKKYQLNTHWLKEDESMRMWYLLQSNTVYMHNIKTDKMYPVIITATQQEHKKRGIVSSRIQYQIEVELSQMRERM